MLYNYLGGDERHMMSKEYSELSMSVERDGMYFKSTVVMRPDAI